MRTWTNRVFEIEKYHGGAYARMTDKNGIFIFRWRVWYDEKIYETFDVPIGVIEQFLTFMALCRQFETPEDAKAWYLKRINRNGRK